MASEGTLSPKGPLSVIGEPILSEHLHSSLCPGPQWASADHARHWQMERRYQALGTLFWIPPLTAFPFHLSRGPENLRLDHSPARSKGTQWLFWGPSLLLGQPEHSRDVHGPRLGATFRDRHQGHWEELAGLVGNHICNGDLWVSSKPLPSLSSLGDHKC